MQTKMMDTWQERACQLDPPPAGQVRWDANSFDEIEPTDARLAGESDSAQPDNLFAAGLLNVPTGGKPGSRFAPLFTPGRRNTVIQRPSIRPIAWALLVSVVVLLASSGNAFAHGGHGGHGDNNFNPYIPIFTRAQVKIEQTAGKSFTYQLLDNAVNYEPLLVSSPTQVNMGFWSGPGNHGSLVRVLDSINVGCMNSPSPNCAVWDEGATSSEQYPQYVKMLEQHWYERGNADGSPVVVIYGKLYKNENPLDFPTADRIWGQYSQRYTDMALEFYRHTGRPVMVWAFVQGASPTRIFYIYEYPELQKLEAKGVVLVHCAKTPDADWRNPDDWTLGTGSAACPSPALLAGAPDGPVNIYNR